MSIAVKVWVTVLLAGLAVYTGWTVFKINNNRRARPAAVDVVRPDQPQPSEALDLGSFEMTERSGDAFNFGALRGKVWIASMFFSSCTHQCRDLNNSIAALHKDPLFKEVQFVSISVDPVVDTPTTLSEHAKLFDADARRWLFLTGDLYEVGRFGRAVNVPAEYKTHTRRLILFDRKGLPRGQFRYNDATDISNLRQMVPQLMAEQAGPSGDENAASAGVQRPADG